MEYEFKRGGIRRNKQKRIEEKEAKMFSKLNETVMLFQYLAGKTNSKN